MDGSRRHRWSSERPEVRQSGSQQSSQQSSDSHQLVSAMVKLYNELRQQFTDQQVLLKRSIDKGL